MNYQKGMLSKVPSKRKTPEAGIMHRFSPLKFGNIPATSTKKKINVFKSFRPNLDEVLDYNISETFLEMEHKGTQINYKETKAEYVPAPEEYVRKQLKKKKVIYSHGGPPQWKFIDEIWLEKQNQLQEVHKKEFEEFVEKRKAHDKYWYNYKQCLVQSLIGPEWYQELSPNQIITVDSLNNCISEDRRCGTSRLTRAAIAQLGLVCRPHHKKIELALQYCCGCPVEFLCILYQLLDPKRQNYSINDRLLLSAVVHLTMSDTLRELHVRIPSPVRQSTKNDKNKRIPKRKKCASPYLEPYTFKPEPAKFTGVYRKKHLQYPESPYFGYLCMLKVERLLARKYSESDLKFLEEEQRELIEETIKAQKIYNQMHNTQDIILLKPTILPTCGDFQAYIQKRTEGQTNVQSDQIQLPSLAILSMTQNDCTCPSDIEIHEENPNDPCSKECKRNGANSPTLQSFCTKCSWKRNQENISRIVTGITIVGCKEVIPIHGGIFFDTNCSCKEELDDKIQLLEAKGKLEKLKQKYIVNSVVITNIGAVYCLSTALTKKLLKSRMTTNNVKGEPGVQTQSEVEQYCKHNNEKVEVGNSRVPEATSDVDCQCKRELDIFLRNKCTCEECNVERRREEATFILSGTQEFENEPTQNVIYGVQDYQCSCLANYKEKLKKVEDYRQRCKAKYELKKKGIKFAVGDVYNTEEGPIYQISGTRPPVDCVCRELQSEEEQLQEERRRLPNMPPTGRIQYEITGVQETDEENVYIISKALETDECDCENLYKEFMKEHEHCWEAYLHFLETMETNKTEYLTEFKHDDSVICDGQQEQAFDNSNKSQEIRNSVEQKYDGAKVNELEFCSYCKPRQKMPIVENWSQCGCYGQIFENTYNTDKAAVFCGECQKLNINNDFNAVSDIVQNKSNECGCECNRSDSMTFDPSYAIKLDPNNVCSEPVPQDVIFEKPEECTETTQSLKRFVLLKEFPTDIRKQRKILKEALASMAEDGFSLAKLPDSHKLPHFKLWMELRSRRKWTQEDRKYYNQFSIFAWSYTDCFYNPIRVPKLNLRPAAECSITWNSAEYFRNLAATKKNMFHRKVKQQLIEKTREFFPTVFAYEFPSRQFRKCYFAYSPNKEEDAIVRN